MNLEQAKETLVNKIEQEFNVYKQQIISNLSKEEIISKAFEISMKDEIRYLISAFTLEKKEVQALLKTDNVLKFALIYLQGHLFCRIFAL